MLIYSIGEWNKSYNVVLFVDYFRVCAVASGLLQALPLCLCYHDSSLLQKIKNQYETSVTPKYFQLNLCFQEKNEHWVCLYLFDPLQTSRARTPISSLCCTLIQGPVLAQILYLIVVKKILEFPFFQHKVGKSPSGKGSCYTCSDITYFSRGK